MELDLDSKKGKHSNAQKGVVQKKERRPNFFTDKEKSNVKKRRKPYLRIGLIGVLLVLVILSVIGKFLPHEELEMSIPIETVEYTETGMRKAHKNDCDFEYDPTIWGETENGVEATDIEGGYYTVDVHLDSVQDGTTIQDLAQGILEQYENYEGILVGSLLNETTDRYNMVGATYSRQEINANNLLTGNEEVTEELFVQPLNQKTYFYLKVKYYVTDGIDYSDYKNALKTLIDSLSHEGLSNSGI